jgi:hypothetical protein
MFGSFEQRLTRLVAGPGRCEGHDEEVTAHHSIF